MIPRTKHLVVGTALSALLVVGVFGASGVGSIDALSFASDQPALLIDTVIREPEVIVLRDTTREDMHASLTERLRAFVEEEQVILEESANSPVVETAVETSTNKTSLWCDRELEVTSRNAWGPVNVTIAEGARVITSLQIDDAGSPLHTLQLPLDPSVTGKAACLPSDMIGVLLDGTVVTPETPIQGDREGLAGYAIDGFPLFGKYEDGTVLTSADLDECHGHVHPIVNQGVPTSMYHYHLTDDAPYSLGCFRGIVSNE
jgi:hypothetical protein